MQDILDAIDSQRDAFIEELKTYLRIESISTDPRHNAEVGRCAEYVLGKLREAGFTGEIHPTSRHPVVYGERIEDPSIPTVLIYGHYDVQPPRSS